MEDLSAADPSLKKSALAVIKIGGNIVDNHNSLNQFIDQFASLPVKKILVHGGGKVATQLADKLQISQKMINGRRITDAETLKLITMVYAGLINKKIVAMLQKGGVNAIGLSGADGNLIKAVMRADKPVDYGYVGDIRDINTSLLKILLDHHFVPVIAPVTHDGSGQLLNTNADTIAQEIAKAVSKDYQVSLVYTFEKAGVLANVNDEGSSISRISVNDYTRLKEDGTVNAGMIPKLDNAFTAINSGVSKVIIGKGEMLSQLMEGSAGTTITT